MKKLLVLIFCFCYVSLMAQAPIEQTRPANIRDGINYLSNGSVILCLFAPYKSTIHVIGDFNNWSISNNHLMKKDIVDNDHVYWWIELTGLNSKTEYAFQYLIDGSLRIADPYTEKILDPTHDTFINTSTYPGLKPYPNGQTEIVSVLFPSQTKYTYQNNSFVRPEKEKLTIYELHLRDFLATHNFKTLSDTLSYFKKLGINAIEIMPLNEFEGNSSWGYNPSFYFAVDKYYGPAEELKKFIDKCHGEGIAVIIDLVLNHSYNASPLVRMYFDGTKPTAQNPWYNSNCVSAFCWGNDFNHTSTATQYFVDRVSKHWLEEYHFDGIRFDFTQGFTQKAGDNWAKDDSRISLVKRMSDQIWNIDPKAYVILEHWTENSEEKILADYGCMLWGNLTHEYNEAAMGWHDDSKSDFSWGYFAKRNWTKPHLVTYMESHDEERVMYNMSTNGNNNGTTYDVKNLSVALERSELDAAFLFTIPGPKMMWQFQELGYDYSIDYGGRVSEKPIRWDYLNNADRKDLYDDYSKLIKLRLAHEVFTSAQTNVTLSLNSTDGLKKIILKHASMNVVIIGNFGVNAGSINPTFPSSGPWYDRFGDHDLYYNGTDAISISLAPGEYRIYTSLDIKNPLPFNHLNSNMYASGTFNAWSTTSHPMQLVADYTWQISAIPLSANTYNMKFTNTTDWSGTDWGNAQGLSSMASVTTGGGANIGFTISQPGNYSIKFNESTLNYEIFGGALITSKPNQALENYAFSSSPNPIIGNSIQLLNPKEVFIDKIKILDIMGNVISESIVNSNESIINIAIQANAGLYFIVIQNKDGFNVLRLTKE